MTRADDQPRLFQLDSFAYNEEDDFLGSGAFGSVFRCRLTTTGEMVALKKLYTPQRLKQSDVKSFMNEVGILQRLSDCPYVIRLLGLCIIPGHYAIAMEYMENGDLENMLLSEVDRHSCVKQWDCRTRMGLEIALGMEFLHSRKPPIIHRDLKTTNVLVDNNYSCKIIDFGLARTRGISTGSTVVQSGGGQGVMGTVAFVAPEIFDAKLDPKKETKADVYSYSMVLWQLKEMKELYAQLSPAIILANVVSGKRPALSDDDCRRGIKELILRCWDPEPDVRLSFREIVTMFEGIRGQPAATPTPVADSGQTHDPGMNSYGLSVSGDTGASSAPSLSPEPQVAVKPFDRHRSPKSSSSHSYASPRPAFDYPSFTGATNKLPFDVTGMSVTSSAAAATLEESPFSSQARQPVPHNEAGPLPPSNPLIPTMTYGMTGFLDSSPLNPIMPVDASVDMRGASSANLGTRLGAEGALASAAGMTLLQSDKKPREDKQIQSLPNRWITLGELPERRHFLNSVATAEGKIVVANLLELYVSDIQSGCSSWSARKVLPQDKVKIQSLFTAQDRCFATYFHSNMPARTQSIARYDIARNSWQRVCDLPSHYQMQYYSAVATGDKVYLVCGGDGAGTAVFDTVLIYDLQSGRQCGSLTLKNKRRSCSSVIIDNVLYVVGGWDGQNHFNLVDAISLSDSSFLTVPPTPTYNCSCTVACGRLVVTDGRAGPLSNSKISSNASILDMLSGTWLKLPKMNDGRLCHGMCAAKDGVIVAVGGNCDGTYGGLKSVEALHVQM